MHWPARLALLTGGALASALLAGAASAHDFWLQPRSFWIAPMGAAPIALQVGHGADRQRWTADPRRIIGFYSLGPKGRTDHRSALHAGRIDQDHRVVLREPGVHVVVLQTNHARSVLPGPRFTEYLKEEGLTPALQARTRAGTTDRPGREIYSRRAKALVQVGAATAQSQPHLTRPAGLTLEIVPESNPYAPGAGPALPVRVYFEGRPLAGALVKLNNLDFDAKVVEQHRTDAAGRAVFQAPRTGAWQLNVVWTKPASRAADAELDTTFSSLTLGYPRGAGN
ncbi:DUF4198 domain-containing protein [Phenylobacterium sp.]|jgi:uncharacterized GH25 family protein|uniref:DUF4198 domain-containing protein n=1 Tax=Phenylobacterium sp. TaxID=1871053 RepID=UPI002E31CB99|nr:DUF4198 domain-containing protein [Phenylobacterium sp.]HEX2560187.1 DUF4198 domain-containing protein [Phenylobacterium sp.]